MLSKFRVPSPGTMLGLLALFVALGGTALAATGQLVNIADGSDSSRLAHVDAAGHVLVGDGAGKLSVDGVVTAQDSSPSALWRASGTNIGSACAVIATPPSGKSVVIKTLTINLFTAPSGTLSGNRFIPVYNNSTCSGLPIWDLTPTSLGVTTVNFDAGIGIPSTGALSTSDYSASNYDYEVYASGFTLAASAIPSTAEPAAVGDSPHSGPPAGAGG